MIDSPQIEFRDGPGGERSGLVNGPDVWELVATHKQTRVTGDLAIQETAELLDLTELQVRTGLHYYSEYPDEIGEWLGRNIEEADEAEATWRQERRRLCG